MMRRGAARSVSIIRPFDHLMISSSWYFEDIHLFVNRYHPILPHQPPSVLSLREGERGSTRSPVNFRQVLLIIVIWFHDLIEAGDDDYQLVLTLTVKIKLINGAGRGEGLAMAWWLKALSLFNRGSMTRRRLRRWSTCTRWFTR